MKINLNKAAESAYAAISNQDMAAINAQAKCQLSPEDVYVFRCEACNDQVDRDFERFTLNALLGLSKLFVGKTMIVDHRWENENQIARIYRSEVEPLEDGTNRLVNYCYMLRLDSTKDAIACIEGGIYREVSVGCAMGTARCSICGEEYGSCGHRKGNTYDGQLCVCELDEAVDAYEMSFVAVPSQPRAGVTKQASHLGWTPAELYRAKARLRIEHERMKYRNEAR